VTIISLPIIDLTWGTTVRWIRHFAAMIRPHFLTGLLIALMVLCFWAALDFYVGLPADTRPAILIPPLVSAAVTLALVLVAVYEIQHFAKTASADLILRLSMRFFDRPDTRIFISLIDGDYLVFESRDPAWHSYFRVNEEEIRASAVHDEIKAQLLNRRAFSCYEMDDLLGQFEDLGDLYKHKTLNLSQISNAFGWHLESAWNNTAIHQYIESQRAQPDSTDAFERFEFIAQECIRFDDAAENN